MAPVYKKGLLTGLVSGLWLLSCFTIVSWLNEHFFNHAIPASQTRSYSGLFSLLILIFGIYLGIKETRQLHGNRISYGQAVKTGIGISVITAIIISLFTLLYCLVINPGYADFMVKETQNELLKRNASPQQINLELQKIKQQFSTASQVMMALIGQLVIGSLASCIIGFFLKKKISIQVNKIK